MNKYLLIALAVSLSLPLNLSAGTLNLPKIDRQPAPGKWPWWRRIARTIPRYDPNSTDPFQVDLRGRNLIGLDLRNALADLEQATFDDATVWPAAQTLPTGYDPGKIMELGKNPGLGLRDLHRQGVAGRGVSIAILDQPLLVDHQEYSERLRLYEEINIRPDMKAQMHGAAVASIAVGKTVGVAPEADLYYIGQFHGDFADGGFTPNFEYLAQGVNRILEINEQLPVPRRVRAISISVGWSPNRKGYQQITEAAEKAEAAGMLVICSSVERVHGFRFHGLGRSPTADPDNPNSYGPGYWWAQQFYEGERPQERLLVPMDSRTTASPMGVDEYVFYRHGGWSWSIPYIAGTYALAAQVEPDITPDRFWALALKTGYVIELHHDGRAYEFGPVLHPAGLIEALRRDDLAQRHTPIRPAVGDSTTRP